MRHSLGIIRRESVSDERTCISPSISPFSNFPPFPLRPTRVIPIPCRRHRKRWEAKEGFKRKGKGDRRGRVFVSPFPSLAKALWPFPRPTPTVSSSTPFLLIPPPLMERPPSPPMTLCDQISLEGGMEKGGRGRGGGGTHLRVSLCLLSLPDKETPTDRDGDSGGELASLSLLFPPPSSPFSPLGVGEGRGGGGWGF